MHNAGNASQGLKNRSHEPTSQYTVNQPIQGQQQSSPPTFNNTSDFGQSTTTYPNNNFAQSITQHPISQLPQATTTTQQPMIAPNSAQQFAGSPQQTMIATNAQQFPGSPQQQMFATTQPSITNSSFSNQQHYKAFSDGSPPPAADISSANSSPKHPLRSRSSSVVDQEMLTPSRRNSIHQRDLTNISDNDFTDIEDMENQEKLYNKYHIASIDPIISQNEAFDLRSDLNPTHRFIIFQVLQYYNFNTILTPLIPIDKNLSELSHQENISIINYNKRKRSLERLAQKIKMAESKMIPDILFDYISQNNQILDIKDKIPKSLLFISHKEFQNNENADIEKKYYAIIKTISCALFYLRDRIIQIQIQSNNTSSNNQIILKNYNITPENSTASQIISFYENLNNISKNYDKCISDISHIIRCLEPMTISTFSSASASSGRSSVVLKKYKIGHAIGISNSVAQLFNIESWEKPIHNGSIEKNAISNAILKLSKPETPCQLLVLSLLKVMETKMLEMKTDNSNVAIIEENFNYKPYLWKTLEILGIGAACALWIFAVLGFWYLAALNSDLSTCMAVLQSNGTTVLGVRIR